MEEAPWDQVLQTREEDARWVSEQAAAWMREAAAARPELSRRLEALAAELDPDQGRSRTAHGREEAAALSGRC